MNKRLLLTFLTLLLLVLASCTSAETISERADSAPSEAASQPLPAAQPIESDADPEEQPVSTVETIDESERIDNTATEAPDVEVETEVNDVTTDTNSAETAPSTEAETQAALPEADDDNYLPFVSTPYPDPVLANGINLEQVGTGYVNPVFVTHAGDERLFVIEQNGYITILRNGQIAQPPFLQPPFLDIDAKVGSGGERGLLSAAFHPDYASNGRFFVYYTDNGGTSVVSEFSVSSGNADVADVNSERIIMEIAQPFGNHNGGQINFGADGYLYIGLGDGGSGGDPENNGQDPSTLLGSILRIDVDGTQPYAVPSDNPFVGDSDKQDEIWSWGWRNPWRFSFDRVTNDMFIGDVGQNKFEEISFESADSTGGLNFGWNVFEGSDCYNGNSNCGSLSAELPIIEYGRDAGCSITGGYIYRGSALPALWGNYLYGDYCTGSIWASVPSEDGTWQTQLVSSANINISSFGEDASGELYVVDHRGTIYRIATAD